ncbi:MAG: DUF4412 domain-containing protein [Polyangiaceae bacterium]
MRLWRASLLAGSLFAVHCKTQSADSLPPLPSAKASAEVVPGGPGALLGDGPFEGEMKFEVEANGQKAVYTLRVKEPKVRMELPAKDNGFGIILYDTKAQTGAMYIMDAAKTWKKLVDLPKGNRRPAQIERTGKRSVVAGYGCEEWHVSQEGRKLEACVAGGVPWGETMRQLATWLPDDGGVPLRVRETDSSGAEKSRIEMQSITRSPQAANLFDPPAP